MTLNANFYQQLKSTFEDYADKVVLEYPAEEGISQLTYRQFDQRINQFAVLLKKQGLRTKDRILVQVGKSSDNLCLYLACLRLGVVYIPLNTGYKSEELAYFIADAEPKIIVCTDEMETIFSQLSPAISLYKLVGTDENSLSNQLDVFSSELSETVVEVISLNEDPAVIIYTSGTTGKPKGAILTHGNLLANSQSLKIEWGFKSEDVLLHALPLFHIHGLFVATHTALLSGAKMILLEKFTTNEVIKYLVSSSVFMGVPTHYTRLLKATELNASLCRNMRLFISGSAPLLQATLAQFKQVTGHTILERYGMSETGINTSNPLLSERKPGTVGKALSGVDVRVVDEKDQPVVTGNIGQIQVKGANVFAGYWRKPEKTAEEFTHDGFFRTGDLGYFDQDGYLTISGRAKDLIISGGYNIYPKEIELVLDKDPLILESAVIGLPDDDFGEAVTAVIVLKGNNKLLNETIIRAYLKENLANFKIPKRFIVVDQLPRNTMGKVQKNKLRQMFATTSH